MKKIWYLFLFCLPLLACQDESSQEIGVWIEPETSFVPILMDKSEMESSIGFLPARPVERPGKLYSFGPYILLNERYQGLHIIDNSDRRNPRPVGFFRIPGNLDMAVKAGQLYADNGTDLLVIDLFRPEAPQVVHRGRDVFPELPPPDLRSVPPAFSLASRPPNTVIVGWQPNDQ
ncbi:MAG: hypothetical protein ACFCUI_13300 [Bernardetiaceae bacterium]